MPVSVFFFWTRNEGPRTGSRQRHHSIAMGKNCHKKSDHDDTTKTTGSLLSVKQTTPVRTSVTAGDTERLPRQWPLVSNDPSHHSMLFDANINSSRGTVYVNVFVLLLKLLMSHGANPNPSPSCHAKPLVTQSAESESAVSSARSPSILCTRRKLLDLAVSLGVASS